MLSTRTSDEYIALHQLSPLHVAVRLCSSLVSFLAIQLASRKHVSMMHEASVSSLRDVVLCLQMQWSCGCPLPDYIAASVVTLDASVALTC